MEKGYTFQPPPFLGSGFRQNHQIRTLKHNSYPFLASRRSLFPSLSHASPSTGLLTSRGAPYGAGFARTNLNSHRRKHLRRCYDLIHVCLQRRDVGNAARFLRVVLAAHEWTTDEGWRLALLLLTLHGQTNEGNEGSSSRGRLEYLQTLDLHSSAPFKATYLTTALVTEYIHANRLSDAIELLEQRINIHPYKSQPELHTLLGMLYLFVGLTTLLNAEEGGVSVRKLDRTTKNKARRCFETALQATEGWRRGETGRRQRIWGMHANDNSGDEAKLRSKRGEVWGRDVMDDEEEWPGEEHRDLKRVRRRLKGGADEEDESRERHEVSDAESSASGSLYEESSPDPSSDDEERGRSRTPVPHPPPLDDLDPEPTSPVAAAVPSKGPQSWIRAWPLVSPFYSPEPPFAFHLAQQFLTLLGPSPTSGSQVAQHRRVVDGNDSDSAEEVVGGIQLTREEAELRLRRILFEEPQGEGGMEAERRVKKEDKKRKREKEDKKRRRDKEDKGRSRDKEERKRKRAKEERGRESVMAGTGSSKRRRQERQF